MIKSFFTIVVWMWRTLSVSVYTVWVDLLQQVNQSNGVCVCVCGLDATDFNELSVSRTHAHTFQLCHSVNKNQTPRLNKVKYLSEETVKPFISSVHSQLSLLALFVQLFSSPLANIMSEGQTTCFRQPRSCLKGLGQRWCGVKILTGLCPTSTGLSLLHLITWVQWEGRGSTGCVAVKVSHCCFTDKQSRMMESVWAMCAFNDKRS